MNRFFQLAFLLLISSACAWAQAPVISPLTPTVNQGGTQQFTCSSNCTGGTGWSVSGTNATAGATAGVGSISGGGLYTAPASVTAQQQLAGYQLYPNNNIFNVRIDNATSGLTGTNFSGTAFTFSILPSFPINYHDSSAPTASMVFNYTPGNNGTYYVPSQNGGLSGSAEGGWYEMRNAVPGVTGTDHHYYKANYQTGTYEEQYQYYPVGNGNNNSPPCPTCTSQSGVKYNSTDFVPTNGGIDAAGLIIMPLMLRRQELDAACASGAGTGTINHALRLTLASGSIGASFVWPAQAFAAGSGSNPYGRRYRLKAAFSEVGYSACAKLILEELKNYGMFLADIGFNGQANIEYAPWSEADVGYLTEVNGIASSNFESVPDASFEISSGTWEATVNREKVCYNSTGGTTCTDINLLGVTVGVTQDAYDIMAGTPTVQLNAVVHGSSNTAVTWTLSSAVGSINSSSGLYTPPATAASESTIIATATSSANSAVSATIILRIWPSVSLYALPSFTAGNDFTDTGAHVWKSGAGIGMNSQQGQIGCCSDLSGSYTGSATNNKLWNHYFDGSLTNAVDNHFYFIAPAGTYTVTFHTIAPFTSGATSGNVNFVAQSSTLASNVNTAAAGVNQFGPYTRTDNVTVGCDNLLNYDEQMALDGGFNEVSSFSIVQNTNTQASCGGGGGSPGSGAGMMR